MAKESLPVGWALWGGIVRCDKFLYAGCQGFDI